MLAPKSSASAQVKPQPKKTTPSQIQNITSWSPYRQPQKKLNSILPGWQKKKKEKEVKEEGKKGGRKKKTIKADLDLMQSKGPRDTQQPTLSGARNQKAQLLQHTCSYSLLQSQTSRLFLNPSSCIVGVDMEAKGSIH